MTPGSEAAALLASLASILARAFRCFLAHSRTPGLSDGDGVDDGTGAVPPPPVTAKTKVLMIKPRAVIKLAIVTPCSRNKVRRRSARVVFSCSIVLIVSRILLICERRTCRVALAASTLDSLSSWRSLNLSAIRLLLNSSSACSSLLFSSVMFNLILFVWRDCLSVHL